MTQIGSDMSSVQDFTPAKTIGGRAAGLGLGVVFFIAAALAGIVFLTIYSKSTGVHINAVGSGTVWDSVITELGQALGVVLTTAALAGGLKLGPAALGLDPRGAGRGLLIGILSGLLLLSAIMGVLIGLHMVSFGPLAPMTSANLQLLLGYAILFTLVAITEEGLMRGLLLNQFAKTAGFWGAAILTSLLFLALHLGNPGESLIGLLNVGLVGLVLAWSRRRTGALWFALGFHAAWDFAQSYLWGVADSGLTMPGALTVAHIQGPDWITGGATGPEGGLLTSLAMIILAVIAGVFWKKRAG